MESDFVMLRNVLDKIGVPYKITEATYKDVAFQYIVLNDGLCQIVFQEYSYHRTDGMY